MKEKATAKAKAKAKARNYLVKMDKRANVTRFSLHKKLPLDESGKQKMKQMGQLPDGSKPFLEELAAKLEAGTITEDVAWQSIQDRKSSAANG